MRGDGSETPPLPLSATNTFNERLTARRRTSALLELRSIQGNYSLAVHPEVALSPADLSVLKETYFEFAETIPSLRHEIVDTLAASISSSRRVDGISRWGLREASAARTRAPTPLRGKFILLISTPLLLLFVFLQSLVYSRTVNGYAVAPPRENWALGPGGTALVVLGGLNTNSIRTQNEHFRLFWSIFMHSGFLHLGMNLLSQSQFLYMYEPDWGIWRTLLIFLVGGWTGNLFSAVADPCTTTVGSSGGLFGLLGACVIYLLEFWRTIPRPRLTLLVLLVVTVASFILGFTANTDNWAHFGGLVGGTACALASLTRFETTLLGCVAATAVHGSRLKDAPDNGRLARDSKHSLPSGDGLGIDAQTSENGGRRRRVGLALLTRCLALLVLAASWATCFTLLYSAYEYRPVGNPHFGEGDGRCMCCHYPPKAAGRQTYFCHLSTAVIRLSDGVRGSWEEYCDGRLHSVAERFLGHPAVYEL